MYPVLILAFSNAFRFHKSLPISSITPVQYRLSCFFTGILNCMGNAYGVNNRVSQQPDLLYCFFPVTYSGILCTVLFGIPENMTAATNKWIWSVLHGQIVT